MKKYAILPDISYKRYTGVTSVIAFIYKNRDNAGSIPELTV